MKGGSESTFRRELVALLPRLRRFGCALTGSLDRADDLVQATCERALTRYHQFEPGTRLDSWTFTIMQSIWRNDLRSQQRWATRELSEADDLVDIQGERRLDARLLLSEVDRIIAALPVQQRAVVMLVAVEGYSYREGAQILEVPMGTVMSRLARARLAIVERLKAGRSTKALETRHAG